MLEMVVGMAERRASGVPIIGVAGAQGSGKTTLLDEYRKEHPSAATFSLDDVYLPSSYRRLMADSVHPLFATRGVPGTHNLTQLNETLDELQSADTGSETVIPSFDKVTDNPAPREQRRVFRGLPSAILLDGWCLGATPQTDDQLAAPVNQMEAAEDAGGVWRREVNANLAGAYTDLFSRLDAILYLEPPSFDVVLDWRCQQEEGLLGRPLQPADRARIVQFVRHFERITRHMMAGGRRADVVVTLDAHRRPMAVRGG